MAKSHILTVEVLRQLLDYDPETGMLTWKVRGPQWFTASSGNKMSHRVNNWNAKWAGKPALNCAQKSGYRNGAVLEVRVQSHRAAYAIATGIELKDIPEVDHINGNRADNRLVNLRLVSHGENARNVSIYKNNKTGVHGVIWEKSHKAWAVKINIDGKQRRIGRFKCFCLAVQNRKSAEKSLGYHKNHGRVGAAIGG